MGSPDFAELIALLNARDAERPRRKRHRLPEAPYTYSDREFFFTLCARHLGTPFTDERLARHIIEALLWQRQQHHWRLFAYCLMPDHLHFIAQLPEESDAEPNNILNQVGAFKSFTTTQCWWKHGGQDQLWQRSSYDRVIRYNDSVEHAVNYLLANPGRKGLIHPGEPYPYATIIDAW
jgi:REP element-mobilizing transposase RayT